jgi:hypothetical protein
MVQRTIIRGGAAAAIQVSLPGFDVTTASLQQMAFDARFGFMQEIKRSSGDFGAGSTDYTYGGNRDVTHYWDYALAQPPLVVARFRNVSPSTTAPYESFVFSKFFGNCGGNYDGFNSRTAIVTTTGVTFRYTVTNNGIPDASKGQNGVNFYHYVFDYVAFRPLSG